MHAQTPVTRPLSPGPYRALIDTGASHSWVKPHIGGSLQPHSLEGYVVDRGDGKEEDATINVKFGFMKGLNGNPVKGWVQLDARLPAIEILLFSGEFNAPADVLRATKKGGTRPPLCALRVLGANVGEELAD